MSQKLRTNWKTLMRRCKEAAGRLYPRFVPMEKEHSYIIAATFMLGACSCTIGAAMVPVLDNASGPQKCLSHLVLISLRNIYNLNIFAELGYFPTHRHENKKEIIVSEHFASLRTTTSPHPHLITSSGAYNTLSCNHLYNASIT